jgi:hypothetical protein
MPYHHAYPTLSPSSYSPFETSIARPLLAVGAAIVVLAFGILVGFKLASERAASRAVVAPTAAYAPPRAGDSAPVVVEKDPNLETAAPPASAQAMAALAPSEPPSTKARKLPHRPHGANSAGSVVPGSKGVHVRAGGALNHLP